MESRPAATRDSSAARKSRVESGRHHRPEAEGRDLLRARKPLGARGADDEADGIRRRRVDGAWIYGLGVHRRRGRGMTSASVVKPEAFEIPCRDGLSIRGEVYAAESALGSVLICHGFKGFAHWAFFPYLGRTLAENGLTAITFDFSGSGIGRDRESFTEPGAFAGNTLSREQEDLENLIDYARRRKLIEGKFGLFGHSRGGGTAILFSAGTDSNVSSLVTWSSISYPNRWSSEDVITWRRQGYADVTNSRTGQIMRLDTDLLDDVELHGKTKLDIESAVRKIKGAPHGLEAQHQLDDAPPVLAKVLLETVKFFHPTSTTEMT